MSGVPAVGEWQYVRWPPRRFHDDADDFCGIYDTSASDTDNAVCTAFTGKSGCLVNYLQIGILSDLIKNSDTEIHQSILNLIHQARLAHSGVGQNQHTLATEIYRFLIY